MVNRFSNFRRFGSVLFLTLLVCNPLWADDIEIFFGRTTNQDIQPNVLFILDGSGSMNWYDCANGKVYSRSCGDGTPAGTTTRLTRLKDSLKDVLNNTSNINVGLMRFSHTNSGGRITYPIRNIDQQLCNGEPCGADTIFTAQSAPADTSDDAAQRQTGTMILDEPTMALMTDPNLPEGNSFIGFRFPDLQIPQGATITDARVSFTSATDSTATTNMVIQAEDTHDAVAYTDNSNNIGSRNKIYNTVGWNSIPDWQKEGSYESPNIASLVQPIISKASWCGGNAFGLVINGMGSRMISTFDAGSSTAPTLRVSYKLDAVPDTGGCTKSSIVSRLNFGTDDAIEQVKANNGGKHKVKRWHKFNIVSQPSSSRTVGYDAAVRFREVNIPQGSTIISASLSLTTKKLNWYSKYPNISISAQDSANPSAISGTTRNISNRQLTSSVNWSNISSAPDTIVTSPDLTSQVQYLVNLGGWESGNSMLFVLKPLGSGGHGFYSYDSNPSQAPLLRIDFETQIRTAQDKINGPVTDVRSEIIAEVDAMTADHGTPTVGALLEAKRYFAGSDVHYGLNRFADRNAVKYPYYRGRYSRVSTPDSYTGGTVVRSASCYENALDGQYCSEEHITGSPVYVSPFTHECQTNHIVLLTDGDPTADSAAANSVISLTGSSCDEQSGGRGTCGEEIAEYMNTVDQHSFGGDQFITTHTIGFNFTTQWLKDVAKAGGGGYYTADTSLQLSSALANIIDSVQDESSSFVAPGATVDNFSKVSHRNDIYLALFQPQSTPGWKGNLKRYDFSGNPAQLHDASTPKKQAVDPETGKFHDDSKSHWSATADGNTIAAGGAASRLLPNARKVYTYTGTNPNLAHGSNAFSIDNGAITAADLSLNDGDTAARKKVIQWALGYDVQDEDNDNNTEEGRYHIGDPLHSRPVIVTYGGTTEDPDSVIYFGTNDGFVHGIETDTGDESFAFIPTELFPNLGPLYESNPASDKIYGMDGAMSLLTKDLNHNGSIDQGDSVFLYMGMRRGGNSYYALDVTDKDLPQFKWQISSGDTGFEELGQTWSQAIPATIKHMGEVKDVVIFGGGYDEEQDDKVTRSPDSIGRAVYIVDANDKTLIWAGTADGGGQNLQAFPEMQYSFPATPKIIDRDGDGLSEHIYIGDMGGRIWRFDLNSEATAQDDFVKGGIVADFGQDGVLSDAIRFYHTPDVSVSNIGGEEYINIAIGSGYQAHPLDTTIEDKFFLVRYPDRYTRAGKFGIPDTSAANASANEDPDYVAIERGDLFDATDNVIGEGNPAEVYPAEQELASSNGWLIDMERNGEKVLGASVTFDNKVLFASYVPGGAPSGCAPEIGHGIFWAVNLWDATPAASSDDEQTGKKLVKLDRNRAIPGGGIPAPVQTLFIESGNNADGSDKKLQIVAISGANNMMVLDSKDLVQRVFWSEYPNF